MIDPISSIAAATTAFNAIKKLVYAGREIEDVSKQLGKWYSAAADFNKTEKSKPPLFKKLFSSGSVEEEALNLTIHRKKLQEQDKEIAQLLDIRFGFGTSKEMLELRRQIKKERERTVYKQMERRKAFFDLVTILILSLVIFGIIGGGIYLVGLGGGYW